MTDEPRPVDEDIDRVVHQMMDVDAMRGFRGRVLARLDDRPRAVRRWFAPVAAAVMALVVLVVLLPRHREPAPLPALATTVTSAEPPAPSTRPLPSPGAPEIPTARASAPQPLGRAAAPVVRAAVADISERTVVIPALPAPDPIAVAPIEPAPVTIPVLETPPLIAVPPIDVPPLPPPSGRN